MKNCKNILWDFDGVILDSMPVREWGFRELLKDYDRPQVEKLISFHLKNGGLSRYVKIRYFFEEILNVEISEKEVIKYASIFSNLMREKLVDKNFLIEDSLLFIVENHEKFNFHIVSGSDEKELQFLCRELNIDKFFKSIEGSPTPKKQLVQDLLLRCNYELNDTCLIGDSINDFDAANASKIEFYGYNNAHLKKYSAGYIKSFKGLDLR